MRLDTRQHVHRVWVAAAAAIAVAFLIGRADTGLRAQNRSSVERWVGTWATAEVGRPQNPVAPAPGPRPFMPNTRCPAPPAPSVPAAAGQTFAPPPYIQFTNQTLRQIVHTSIGGSKV